MTYEAHLSRRRESREEDEALECAWECAFYATSKYELYADKTAKAAFEARASHEAHGKAARAVITSVSEMNTRAIEAYGEKAERDQKKIPFLCEVMTVLTVSLDGVNEFLEAMMLCPVLGLKRKNRFVDTQELVFKNVTIVIMRQQFYATTSARLRHAVHLSAERDPESLARDAYLELLQENKAYKSEFDKVVTEKIYSLLTAVIQPALKATMENKDVVCLLKTFDLHRLILNYFMSVRRNARAIQDRDKTTREPKFVEKYVRAEAQMKLACNRLCELSISLVEKHSVAAVTRALIGVHTKEVVREIEGELKNFHDKYKVSTAATVASSDLKVENMSDDEL